MANDNATLSADPPRPSPTSHPNGEEEAEALVGGSPEAADHGEQKEEALGHGQVPVSASFCHPLPSTLHPGSRDSARSTPPTAASTCILALQTY